MFLWFLFCCCMALGFLSILSLVNSIRRHCKLKDIVDRLSVIEGVEGATYSSIFLDDDNSVLGTNEAAIYVAVWDHGLIDRTKLLDIEDYIENKYHQVVNIHVTAHQGRGVNSVLTFGIRIL